MPPARRAPGPPPPPKRTPPPKPARSNLGSAPDTAEFGFEGATHPSAELNTKDLVPAPSAVAEAALAGAAALPDGSAAPAVTAPDEAPAAPAVTAPDEAPAGYELEEQPTLSVSKPLLNLLARETAPYQAPEPSPAVIVAPQVIPSAGDLPSHTAEIEDTKPGVRVKLQRSPKRTSNVRSLLLITASALALGVLGTAVWIRSQPKNASLSTASATQISPAANQPKSADPAMPAAPDTAAVGANIEAAADVAPGATDVAPAAAKEVVAPAAATQQMSLLANDGSEATAPTCDELLASVSPGSDKKWGFDHVRDARRALVRGDVDGSQRAFCQASRAGNADAVVAFELAQLLLLRRDASAAAEWARRAAHVEPQSARVLGLLGDALVRTGNLDEARKAWLASAKLGETDQAGIARMAQQTFDAAEGALKERDFPRAERLLRRVIALQPENARAHAKMGIALTKLGFAKSAEAWSQRATELDSQSASGGR
ncbi:MAG: tetratricopeptide repeat protein [Myxococcota bacterium]